jgi:putative phosphoribosyl transferase
MTASGRGKFKHLTDRVEAGRRLAALLLERGFDKPLVYAIPRGGVPVALIIAQALDAQLDLLPVCKLCIPGRSPSAFGALAEGVEEPLFNSVACTGLAKEAMAPVVARERSELARRVKLYLDGRERLDPKDRTVILVDDGISTGITAYAALHALRQRGAARIILAVPIADDESRAMCQGLADEIVTADPRRWSFLIAALCGSEDQLNDSEMLSML